LFCGRFAFQQVGDIIQMILICIHEKKLVSSLLAFNLRQLLIERIWKSRKTPEKRKNSLKTSERR
jgi:hypothetical protein